MLNKTMFLAGVVSSVSLGITGCSDWSDHAFVHEARILTTLEKQDDRILVYPNTRNALLQYGQRTYKRKNLPQEQTFCDMRPFVKLDEASWEKAYKMDMNSIFKSMYGKTYDEACGYTTSFKTRTPEIEVINTAKNSGVLSNDQVREVTEAVKTCDRAKFKVMSIKDSGKKLTVNDYESIMDITADCNDYLLEKALND